MDLDERLAAQFDQSLGKSYVIFRWQGQGYSRYMQSLLIAFFFSFPLFAQSELKMDEACVGAHLEYRHSIDPNTVYIFKLFRDGIKMTTQNKNQSVESLYYFEKRDSRWRIEKTESQKPKSIYLVSTDKFLSPLDSNMIVLLTQSTENEISQLVVKERTTPESKRDSFVFKTNFRHKAEKDKVSFILNGETGARGELSELGSSRDARSEKFKIEILTDPSSDGATQNRKIANQQLELKCTDESEKY